jgi:hypothetical protein
MDPQERKMIEDLAGKLAQTQLGQKDAEADSLIRQQIGALPDSLYMLVQTVLVQNLALEQAKAQIADLQQKVASAQAKPAAPTSFLGSLFGGGSHSEPPPPPRPAVTPAPAGQRYGAPPPGYAAPPPGYGAPPPGYAAPPAYGAPPPAAAPGGGSSFLRSAATTAAGVAAGALAFEGISSLMHGGLGGGGGFGGGGFGHQGGSGFMGSAGQPGETIINNYYDSPQDDTPRDDNMDTSDRADNLVASDDSVQDDTDDTTDYQDTSVDDDSYDDSGMDDGGGGGDDFV